MANILCLNSAFNKSVFKFVSKWKLYCKSVDISAVKFKYNNKWSHFTKRKIVSNAKEPLSLSTKIAIGISASVVVKILGDHTVFCIGDVEERTTLVTTNTDTQTYPDFNWTKFFQLLKPYWLEIIGAILAAMVCALLNIQIPRTLGELVNVLAKITGPSEHVLDSLKIPAYKMIAFYSLQSLFTFIYIALLANIGEGIAKTMKANLFSTILDQDIVFFDRNRSGEILNRLTIDIQDFKSSFKMIISQGLRNITQIIGCSVSLLLISPTMTAVMMVIVPTVILTGTLIGSFLRQLSHDSKSQAAKVTLVASEIIGNIRTVRSFAMEDLEKKIFNDEAELCKKLNIKLGYGIALFQAGTNLFLNGMVLSTIYFGGYMMSIGNISAGDLMAFLAAVQLLQRSISQISFLFGAYIRGKHAGARIFEIIELPPGQTLGEGKIIPYHALVPNVQYNNVGFSYPTRPNKEVLKKVNLYIPEGKTVAIVGSSGSGKSTLAWLLERFYDVDEGSILLDGVDIKTLNSKWLRRSVVGFISQEPVLFATTVMENIRFGKLGATDEEVFKAAKLANAHEFILEFPEGYQTMVGERGVSVSGGQKQRIAIARALLKNPSILILDEATSALDSESEKAVQEALDNVTKSRTTIIIAHRLSTIRNADMIVVLNNGVIVESGTHKELLAKKGMYAALVNQQIQNYTPENSPEV